MIRRMLANTNNIRRNPSMVPPYGLVVIHKSGQAGKAVIPAGIAGIQKPWRANSSQSKCLILIICSPQFHIPVDWIPAILAGMTYSLHLCITASAERGNDTNQVSLSSNTIPVYSIALPSICQPGHCNITHYSRFYVASLRRCVKPSFAFLAMRHAIQWAKIFFVSRNGATTQR